MTIPEQAVQAAKDVLYYANPNDVERALTAAALPFLPVQGAGVSADARQALDRFSFAAQQWGWQADQGSNDAIINDAKAEFDASYAALERILSALEQSAARELALEDGELQELLERLDAGLEYEGWAETDGAPVELFDVEAAQDLFADAAAAIRALSSPDHADAGKVEGEWHRENGERSILLYTLRQDGWRKGKPVVVNDVTVRIERCTGSSADISHIADTILTALPSAPSQEVAGS